MNAITQWSTPVVLFSREILSQISAIVGPRLSPNPRQLPGVTNPLIAQLSRLPVSTSQLQDYIAKNNPDLPSLHLILSTLVPISNKPDANLAKILAALPITVATIKTHYPDFSKIYTGSDCKSCGVRIADKDKMAQHKDWHFRLNRRIREGGMQSRDWYFNVDEWCKSAQSLKQVDQPEVAALKEIETQESLSSIPIDQITSPSCRVCGEDFEKVWDEDEEVWVVKGVVKLADGQVMHYACFMDSGGFRGSKRVKME